jgi:hypothetical protein
LQLAQQIGQHALARALKDAGAKGPSRDRCRPPTGRVQLGGDESRIWYLGHSGWAVKTANHFLVFDSGDVGRRADEPSLASGDIDPCEIAYEYIEPHKTRTIDGRQVTTLRANDSGGGFVVDVDGLTIFHPGDHTRRTLDGSDGFQEEIAALLGQGVHPDIAFIRLTGCGMTDQTPVRLGTESTVSTLKPRVLFPMEGGAYGTRYVDFIAGIQGRYPRTQRVAACCKGDHFRYRQGKANCGPLAGLRKLSGHSRRPAPAESLPPTGEFRSEPQFFFGGRRPPEPASKPDSALRAITARHPAAHCFSLPET